MTDGTAGSVKRVDRRTGAVSVYAHRTAAPGARHRRSHRRGVPGRTRVRAGHHGRWGLRGRAAHRRRGRGDLPAGPRWPSIADRRHRRLVRRAPTEARASSSPPACQYAIGRLPRRVPRHRRAPQPGAPGRPRQARSPRSRPSPDVVPTGLEVQGSRIWVTLAGPVPHVAEDRAGLALDRSAPSAGVARGARLARRRGARPDGTSCMPCHRACGTASLRGLPLFRTPGDSPA